MRHYPQEKSVMLIRAVFFKKAQTLLTKPTKSVNIFLPTCNKITKTIEFSFS